MVALRSVVGEESQFTSAEERLLLGFQSAAQQPQVGLLVGKLSPNVDRGMVYSLVPTPPTDSGLPPCNLDDNHVKTTKKKSSGMVATPLVVDTEWVAEHARQVSAMLLGGMHVVGVYVWASEPSFKASTPMLSQTVKAVAQTSPLHVVDLEERLLLHLSYSPRRWTCRVCSLTSSNATSSLRPCDFKMGKLLSSLQTFRCTYNFEMRLPISHETSNLYSFKDVLHTGISFLVKELKNVKVLIDGNLVTDDLQCASEGPHDVEILSPFMKEPSESCRTAEVVSLVVFKGSICASAYIGTKAPMSQAISDIKGDIISSLQSRLDIVSEELEEEFDEEKNEGTSVQKSDNKLMLHELRKSCNLLFPKRVLVPWLSGIFICDYLKHSETYEDVRSHCKEVMSLEVSADDKTILVPEKEAQFTASQSFWTSATGISASSEDCVKKNVNHLEVNHQKHFNFNVVLVIFVLVVSVLVAYCLTFVGRKKMVL